MVYAETVLAYLLAAQGLMGAIDTLVNHEFLERLPQRVEARREIALHSIREAAAYVIAGLLVLEIVVDAVDEWTENRIRVLPQNERVLHVILTLNLGAIVVLLALTVAEWRTQPTALVFNARGWVSWLLLFLAVSSAAWSVRDFVAWASVRRL